MIDSFKIDLRTLTDIERKLIEAAMEKLAEAATLDTPSGDPMPPFRAYRDAGRLAQAFVIIRDRKPKPAPRTRSDEKADPQSHKIDCASLTTNEPRPVCDCGRTT